MRVMKRISRLLVLLLILSMVLSAAAEAVTVSDFKDVPKNAWYRANLEFAVARGLMAGTSATTFEPNANMTRGQFITVLANMMDGTGTYTGKFTDVPKGKYYTSPVYWGVAKGIVGGTTETTFSPNAPITRQDAFVMLGHAIEVLNLDIEDATNPPAAFQDINSASNYAKSSIELLRLKGLVGGYSDGTVRPKNLITRAEGMTIFVNFYKRLSPDTVAAPSVNGALHVEGTQLVDQKGNPVQLRGVSTHGLSWFPEYVNKDLFVQLRQSWGVNAVRLAMYTEEYNGYCSGGDQKKLKQLIRDGVDYATRADMYVIVDWHILSDGNPNTHKSEAMAFFKEMSKEFAKNNNVIYEICNEPNGGTTWSQVKSYAEAVIPVIRANDKDAVIIVGTPTWSQDVDKAAANPITGQKNIMYALHFYAATHKADLRNKMVRAIQAGLPVFVSEYGICDASGNGAIDTASANEWVRTMDAYGVSYMCWNLSNKNESSSLIKSSCTKTAGMTRDELSKAGQWLLGMLAAPGYDGSAPPTSGGTGGGTSGGNTASGGSANIGWSAQCTNSWGNGSDTYYQFDVKVTNTGSAGCTSWSIDIPFSESFSVDQLWCGSYTVSGKTLRITNADYNGEIPAGGSVENVGFIIKGSSALHIVS